MSLLYIDPFSFYDTDAQAYITAVEAADGQGLEDGVKNAINSFVIGCKADGIWTALKACCILSGARTLNGALVSLVGTAPTNFNFVSGDYDRKTGLKGNGSTKYLDSNRNNNADPQNSKHLAVWRSVSATNNAGFLGSGNSTGHSHLYTGFGVFIARNNEGSGSTESLTLSPAVTFYGTSRSSSAGYTNRHGNTNYAKTITSQTPANANLLVFRLLAEHTDARLAYYSIGESLDLALLDARVTSLYNAYAAAIP
jgi:hypothetical protein